MSLPDFLCIGAQKAGTTWLHSMLVQHPDVYLGPLKEYQFFNTLFVPFHRRWTYDHVNNGVKAKLLKHIQGQKLNPAYVALLAKMIDPDIILTEEWYRTIFSVQDAQTKCRGDITPEYSTLPDEGVRYVKELLGEPRLIYIIRDPYKRAVSQLRMNVSRRLKGKEPTEDQWKKWVEDPNLISKGDYMMSIPRWLKAFSDEAMLFIPFQDLSSRPEEVIRDVESHLNLPEFNYQGLEEKAHETKKIELPQYVDDLLRERTEPQRGFIEQQLGKDFAGRI